MLLQVRPLLDCIGRGVMDVGDSARLGNTMKLVGNYYIMSMLELIAEGMTLGEKNGLDRQHVVHFLKEVFQGPITGGQSFLLNCSFPVVICHLSNTEDRETESSKI